MARACASSTTRNASSTIARAFSNATRTGSSSRRSCGWSRPMRRSCAQTADDILKVRNEKFPVTMKCAGSIFKNLLLARIAARGGGAGSGSGGSGRQGSGGVVSGTGGRERACRAATSTWPTYHANLIYNAGRRHGARICAPVIEELKARVRARVRDRNGGRSAVRGLRRCGPVV